MPAIIKLNENKTTIVMHKLNIIKANGKKLTPQQQKKLDKQSKIIIWLKCNKTG
jgi:hypothetical protein